MKPVCSVFDARCSDEGNAAYSIQTSLDLFASCSYLCEAHGIEAASQAEDDPDVIVRRLEQA